MRALDGVRALAVAGVEMFHLPVTQLAGGYLGVDLFLMLSGYLITALLMAEAEGTGRIRLGRFWMRRIRRLVPALVLMLMGSAAWMALVDWSLLAGHQHILPWGLAGGLDPTNVGDALAATHAPLVDVSSGVESAPGVKDMDKMARFCQAVANHDQHRNPA